MKYINAGTGVILALMMTCCNLVAAAEATNEMHKKQCTEYGCIFDIYNDFSNFIQARRLPQIEWEDPDMLEMRHRDFMRHEFIPCCESTTDLRVIAQFIRFHSDKFPVIKLNSSGLQVTSIDQDHARTVLSECSSIFTESKQKYGYPIVVDTALIESDESTGHIMLKEFDSNAVERTASRLARMRMHKDADFHTALSHIALIRIGNNEGLSYVCFKNPKFRDACIALFDQEYKGLSQRSSAASSSDTASHKS